MDGCNSENHARRTPRMSPPRQARSRNLYPVLDVGVPPLHLCCELRTDNRWSFRRIEYAGIGVYCVQRTSIGNHQSKSSILDGLRIFAHYISHANARLLFLPKNSGVHVFPAVGSVHILINVRSKAAEAKTAWTCGTFAGPYISQNRKRNTTSKWARTKGNRVGDVYRARKRRTPDSPSLRFLNPIAPSPSSKLAKTSNLPSKMHLTTAAAGLVALASIVSGQSVTQVSDFNQSPTKLKMYVKVGKNLKTPAPIVVAVHHCQGSATGYSGNTKYPQLADQHGFIAIYPNSRSSGGCFDVASAASRSSTSAYLPPPPTNISFSSSQTRRWRRLPDHCQHGQICCDQVRRRPDARLCCRHELGRHDDQRAPGDIPRRVRGRISLLGCAGGMLRGQRSHRHPRSPGMGKCVRQRPVEQDRPGMGQHCARGLSRIQRHKAENSDLPWNGR